MNQLGIPVYEKLDVVDEPEDQAPGFGVEVIRSLGHDRHSRQVADDGFEAANDSLGLAREPDRLDGVLGVGCM